MKTKGILLALETPKQWTMGLLIAAVVFSSYLLVMSQLPGESNHSCEIGAGLTPLNVGFSIALSLMTGVMVLGMHQLYKKRRLKFVGTGGTGIFGLFIGFFSVFCVLCTLPVISVFGLSFGLSFLSENGPLLQSISVSMMAFALYLMNQQLEDCGCDVKF